MDDLYVRLQKALDRQCGYLLREFSLRGNGDVLQPGRERVIRSNITMLKVKLAECAPTERTDEMTARERVLRLLDQYAETRQSDTLVKLAGAVDAFRQNTRHLDDTHSGRRHVERRLAEVMSGRLTDTETTDGR